MEIALHIGANCTDQDMLLKSILKNGDVMAAHNVGAPGPGKYRRLLRETIQVLNGSTPGPDARQILLDSIVGDAVPDRLVLSNTNFICIPNRIFENGLFYPQAEFKLRGMMQLFPQDEFDIYLALRDPATFLPDAYARSKAESYAAFLQGHDPHNLQWSDLVRRIRRIAPQAALTVWCNEDTPLIWSELVRDIAGLDHDVKITGGFDLLATIMSQEGMGRLLAYLRAHPPRNDAHKRQVIAAFLDKYARDDVVDETVDLPGMTADDVADLSAAYDEDVALIAGMPDVTFVAP
ncbi:hypothetical protein SAMN04488003_101391 [Loktanella fryxellensis]|uniref:Sulfotransferase family protein n=1 Tax=Loktanella fryxellensis TaxID=245187 RepID=A0A1H7Z2L2_9RHOB|nr:hypothetical protein [Loktanella fryxellensis]SEM51709.1 hypothetical protein SAMN04488003_101391 [Loktanella fryxellensis]